MTIHELINILRMIPNQNLPVKVEPLDGNTLDVIKVLALDKELILKIGNNNEYN